MLKTFLKSYYKNIKHVFTCLGMFFCFLVGGLAVLFKGLYKVCVYIVEGIAGLAGELMDNVGTYMSSLFTQLVSDVENNKFDITIDYLKNLLSSTASTSFSQTIEKAQEIVENAMNQAIGYFVIFLVILVIGVIISFIFTRKFVRGSMLKGKFFRRLLISIPYLIVIFGLPALALATHGFLRAVLTIIAVTTIMFGSLFEAYLIHKNENLRFKEVVNFKNSMMLLLSEILCLVFSSLLILVFYLIQPVVGIILVVPFLIVSLTVIGNNAESYVISLVEKKNLDIPEVKTE